MSISKQTSAKWLYTYFTDNLISAYKLSFICTIIHCLIILLVKIQNKFLTQSTCMKKKVFEAISSYGTRRDVLFLYNIHYNNTTVTCPCMHKYTSSAVVASNPEKIQTNIVGQTCVQSCISKV